MSSTADRQTRAAALFRTKEHGLDYVKVAIRTVELIIAEAIDVCSFCSDLMAFLICAQPSPSLDRSQLFDASADILDRQVQLVRSVEWLTFDRSTYLDAQLQANAIIRMFLSIGR